MPSTAVRVLPATRVPDIEIRLSAIGAAVTVADVVDQRVKDIEPFVAVTAKRELRPMWRIERSCVASELVLSIGEIVTGTGVFEL